MTRGRSYQGGYVHKTNLSAQVQLDRDQVTKVLGKNFDDSLHEAEINIKFLTLHDNTLNTTLLGKRLLSMQTLMSEIIVEMDDYIEKDSKATRLKKSESKDKRIQLMKKWYLYLEEAKVPNKNMQHFTDLVVLDNGRLVFSFKDSLFKMAAAKTSVATQPSENKSSTEETRKKKEAAQQKMHQFVKKIDKNREV